MGTPTLGRVAPVSASIGEVQHGPSDGGGRRREPRRRPQGRDRLLAAALPGVDADTCVMTMELDAEGALREVVISESAGGKVLVRLTAAQVARILGDGGQAGIFFERKG